MRDQVL